MTTAGNAADPASRPAPGTAADRAKAVAQREAASRGENATQTTGIRPAVVLVGPPGSGKTTVGAAISRMTGLKMRDTDADIETGAGRSIPDIFLQDGEPEFRRLERLAVATALAEHDGVLALGGGAVVAAETRELLAGHDVVFLNLSMPTGVRRTGLSASRPLLAGVNPRATYKALLDARLAFYRETARVEIETDQLSVSDVARLIVKRLELV